MKKFLKESLSYIIVIVAVILIRTFIATPIRVSGPSMETTLYNGNIMILNKLGKIDRNDIVVVDKSILGSAIIKRVIGMPGETIACKEGQIYLNDEKYEDKFAFGITSDFAKVTLQENEYFVLGDNRIVSQDSRCFGPVNGEHIKGTNNFMIYPFAKFGKLQ